LSPAVRRPPAQPQGREARENGAAKNALKAPQGQSAKKVAPAPTMPDCTMNSIGMLGLSVGQILPALCVSNATHSIDLPSNSSSLTFDFQDAAAVPDPEWNA
jgi:hypothetical protein